MTDQEILDAPAEKLAEISARLMGWKKQEYVRGFSQYWIDQSGAITDFNCNETLVVYGGFNPASDLNHAAIVRDACKQKDKFVLLLREVLRTDKSLAAHRTSLLWAIVIAHATAEQITRAACLCLLKEQSK